MQAHAGHAWEHSGTLRQLVPGLGLGACAEGGTRVGSRLHSRLSTSPYLRAAEAGVEQDAPRRAQVRAVHLPRCKEGACA